MTINAVSVSVSVIVSVSAADSDSDRGGISRRRQSGEVVHVMDDPESENNPHFHVALTIVFDRR